ncbi:glycosyltransferase [Kocuria rosea]|uniref:glycosyltransferase n=1 Tax=Kocuria rosea TaxID=1275 RepID=UPI0011107201|nr:glycosyltransferase [Kocuria rosea]QCY33609.1 glycosyltransferase [Kocuria rosea]TQN35809.1 glycosyl transferase family 1 [Kocuria rosea]
MIAKAKVVIVQPYVPTYRVAFFERLRDKLAAENIECLVAAGAPAVNQAKRGDAAQENWVLQVDNKSLSVRGKSIGLGYRRLPWKEADAVILGLEGTSLPVYQALMTRRRTGTRVGLWGHVRPYVTNGNKADLWLEKKQMMNADRIFAYTPGGHNYAVSAGISSSKVTTVMNSIDTAALERARNELTQEVIAQYAREYGINPDKAICFIGGLDESKRISFLREALNELWLKDPSIRLLVGGDGPQKCLLRAAVERGQVVDMGYMNVRQKALAMSASRCVAMPGRIGLVAVDSLVMNRPVVTTNWPYHAPEAEYLVEGQSRHTSADNPHAFASALLRVVASTETVQSFDYPTLEEMVENFASGILNMMRA